MSKSSHETSNKEESSSISKGAKHNHLFAPIKDCITKTLCILPKLILTFIIVALSLDFLGITGEQLGNFLIPSGSTDNNIPGGKGIIPSDSTGNNGSGGLVSFITLIITLFSGLILVIAKQQLDNLKSEAKESREEIRALRNSSQKMIDEADSEISTLIKDTGEELDKKQSKLEKLIIKSNHIYYKFMAIEQVYSALNNLKYDETYSKYSLKSLLRLIRVDYNQNDSLKDQLVKISNDRENIKKIIQEHQTYIDYFEFIQDDIKNKEGPKDIQNSISALLNKN